MRLFYFSERKEEGRKKEGRRKLRKREPKKHFNNNKKTAKQKQISCHGR